jgi:hypothetical protein
MLTRDDFCDPFEPIYSFVASDGTNTHIASARLRVWCLEQTTLERVYVPVEQQLAAQFISENIVSGTRVGQLVRTLPSRVEDWEPLIFAKDGQTTRGRPDVMLVDGHHRYVLAALASVAPLAWVLEPEQWRPFQIADYITLTQEELREMPILAKEHWK